jgi:PAS domain S-box-containing protein
VSVNVTHEAAGFDHHLTPVCAIGASAGGLKALKSLLGATDTDLGLAYVVIMHLAPDHPSHLAEILQGYTSMPIHEVTDTQELKPDCVYVIPPDRELVIDGNQIKARSFREARGLRAPIDMLFRSVAQARNDSYAIVLTGDGADGAVGVRKVAEAGGLVMVQDPREAEFAMMPLAAIATGVVNFIEPLAAIPARIAQTLKAKAALMETDKADANRTIGHILSFLRPRIGGGEVLPAEVEISGDEALGADEIESLRHKLHLAQKRLGCSRREHESAIHELRLANEELQSVNEEYRSAAEELETSNVEMQSITDDLRTVNSKLKAKLAGLASAHSDLQNLVNTADIGTLFLDPDLRIRMLTPAVKDLFSVTGPDIGRPISDFSHKLEYTAIEDDAATVLRNLVPFEKEVKTKTGRWLLMRLRPYRAVDGRIDGIVVSFIDITRRLSAQEDLRQSEERYRRMIERTAAVAQAQKPDKGRI